MGRKVNPIGFRLPVRRDWKSRWYAKGRNYSNLVIKDVTARRMIEKEYATAMISNIEIEQKIGNIRLIIHAARPGVVIGKKGEGIERLRIKLRKIFDSNEVQVDMKEIAQPETDAKVVALNIANQLENRVMFRRAMRRALANAMRLKVDGIKIMSAGRLNGIEIARTEWYREGRVPLHTLKNNIDYGCAEANTAMGVVGIKVWISKGDIVGLRKKAKYTIDGAEEELVGEEAAISATAVEVQSAAEEVESTTAAKKVTTKRVIKKVVKEDVADAVSAEGAESSDSVEAVAKKPAAKKTAAKKAAVKKPAAKKAVKKKDTENEITGDDNVTTS